MPPRTVTSVEPFISRVGHLIEPPLERMSIALMLWPARVTAVLGPDFDALIQVAPPPIDQPIKPILEVASLPLSTEPERVFMALRALYAFHCWVALISTVSVVVLLAEQLT